MEANSGLPLLSRQYTTRIKGSSQCLFFVCYGEQTNNLRVLCGGQHNFWMQATLFRVEASDRD
jgi:hypothetical protein